MRRRDDEDLALDRVDVPLPDDRAPIAGGTDQLHRRSVDELRNELAELHARIGTYPDHLADQLQAARTAHAEAQRTAADARRRVDELQSSPNRLLRRRTRDPAALAIERERLALAEHHATAAAEREHELGARVPDRTDWDAARSRLRERATALETELALRRSEHVRDALQQPGPHLIAALGEPPEHPRAQRTWQQAAQRIEAYRFDHAITNHQRTLRAAARRHPRASTMAPSTSGPRPSPARPRPPHRPQPKLPGPHLIAALGEPPDHPRAQRTWQQTAQRVEAYRFDHAITDPNKPFGPQPVDTHGRQQWRRAHQELARAQRDLGRHLDRSHGHEV